MKVKSRRGAKVVQPEPLPAIKATTKPNKSNKPTIPLIETQAKSLIPLSSRKKGVRAKTSKSNPAAELSLVPYVPKEEIKKKIDPTGRNPGWKPQTVHSPEETNAHLARGINSITIKGLVVRHPRKKHIYPEERKCRDHVIGHTEQGKRIFAFNKQGIPICFSKIPGQPHRRCQSPITFKNGRCKLHGGKSISGIDHWNATHLRTAASMPRHLQEDMRRAELDPDLASMDHELHLTDVELKRLKESLPFALNETSAKIINNLIGLLEDRLEAEEPVPSTLLEEIVKVHREGKSEDAIWKKMRLVREQRRKIALTKHTRDKDLQLMMRADEADTLVTGIIGATRYESETLWTTLAKRYKLIDKETGKEVSRPDESIRIDYLFKTAEKLKKLTSGGSRPTSTNDEDTLEGEFEVK